MGSIYVAMVFYGNGTSYGVGQMAVHLEQTSYRTIGESSRLKMNSLGLGIPISILHVYSI